MNGWDLPPPPADYETNKTSKNQKVQEWIKE